MNSVRDNLIDLFGTMKETGIVKIRWYRNLPAVPQQELNKQHMSCKTVKQHMWLYPVAHILMLTKIFLEGIAIHLNDIIHGCHTNKIHDVPSNT